jgi:hypothetical protein
MAVAVEASFEHGDDCECLRCRGFEPGNDLARRHGGYSLAGISDRAAEIADQVRPTLPFYSGADEPTLLLFATTLARIERANRAIEAVDEEIGIRRPLSPYMIPDAPKLQRLREDLRAWIGLARRLANDLGLSPMSRAKLAENVAVAQKIGADLVERYGGTIT